jgi:hypothetical protein
MTDENRRRLWAAILKDRERPHEERWQEMIDDGVIDAKGNVLLRGISPIDYTLEPDPNDQAPDNGQSGEVS